MTTQIFLGSLMLGLCSAVHVGLLFYTAQALRRIDGRVSGNPQVVKFGTLIGVAFLGVVLAHTIQV